MATDENAMRLVQRQMESGMHSEGEQESIHGYHSNRNQPRTSCNRVASRKGSGANRPYHYPPPRFIESCCVISETKPMSRRLDGRHK
jgi:hypothetical protein